MPSVASGRWRKIKARLKAVDKPLFVHQEIVFPAVHDDPSCGYTMAIVNSLHKTIAMSAKLKITQMP